MSAAAGTLIAESLKDGAVVSEVAMTVTRISRRADVGDIAAGQPRSWTFIEFEVQVEDAARLALALEGSLRATSGWYCDFHSAGETFVVFADRTFRYARGDARGRADATEYGRSVGVPEGQLDWPA